MSGSTLIYILCGILSFLVTTGQSAITDVRYCQTMETFYDGCNTCICTISGVVACTKAACNGDEGFFPRNPPVKCKVGTTFLDGCNRCICDKNYEAVCTKNCPKRKINTHKTT